MKKLFSNSKRVILDRLTGNIINTNTINELSENFYGYEQVEASNLWTIKHKFLNSNYLIDVYILQDDNTHKKVIPAKVWSENNNVIYVDFSGIDTSGFANILFIDNDIEIVAVTPTNTPTPTVTPTPSVTPTP